MQETSNEAEKPQRLLPPRWLSKSEKHEFRRLIEARAAAGKPVAATERDLLVDYINSRSRLNELRALAKRWVAECKTSTFISTHRHAASLLRQCDAATAASRRLARELKLIDIE